MPPSRRDLFRAGASAAGCASLRRFPAILRDRPTLPCGVATGDPSTDGAVVWARADRPSRMLVELAATEAFRDPLRIDGPEVLPADDCTGRVLLEGLPAGSEVFYRVSMVDLTDRRAVSEPVMGRFRTAPADRSRPFRLLWSGDTCGQGFGIDPARGGLRGYAAMRAREAHAFLHCGDLIYADNPILPEVALPDGTTWRNVTTPETSKVAETLDEFRGRYRYNLLDEHARAFHAEVPLIALWDDHETTNNWYPGEVLDAEAYTVKSVDLLAARARRAFLDYVPLRRDAARPDRIHRRLRLAPDLDLFVLDMRSFRGPNTSNDQSTESDDTRFLGAAQFRWLLAELIASRATWKVIAADMPLGLVVGDGPRFEAVANGIDGPPRGREQELARLLSALHAARVEGLVWLTADVHYTAAHHFHPDRAGFRDFSPFWEFVSGPLHAGTFGPGVLDPTFGPEQVFAKAPPPGRANLSPAEGLQFFGELALEPGSRDLRVSLLDVSGSVLFEKVLQPKEG